MEQYDFPEDIIENYKQGGVPELDGQHTVFGQVFEGMDIVDKIAEVEVDDKAKPLEDVVILSIEVQEGN
jgi:cyclophilin family peptidyl-prolyl cis-trans isomerase